jgi:hypothetical protein
MLTLKVVKRGPPPTLKYNTETLCLNPNNIISIAPADHSRSVLKEINGVPAGSYDLSEIEYQAGGRTERVLVVGNYAEILKQSRSSRTLLNG